MSHAFRPRMKPGLSQSDLAALLAESLGDAIAKQVVREAAGLMGLPEDLDHNQAIALLERVATRGGLVGITARFAMSRLHLQR